VSDQAPPEAPPKPKKGGRRRKPGELTPPPPRAITKVEAPPPPALQDEPQAAEEDPYITQLKEMKEAGEWLTPQQEADIALAEYRRRDAEKQRRKYRERRAFYQARLRGDRQAHIPFDDKAKEMFLLHLERLGSFQGAADEVGNSISTVYHHRRTNPDFAQACEEALERFRQSLVSEAVRRGVHGVERPVFQQGKFAGVEVVYSDRLLEILLKAKLVEFKDSVKVEQTGSMHLNHTAVPTAELEAMMADPGKRQALMLLLEEGKSDGPTNSEPGDPDQEK